MFKRRLKSKHEGFTLVEVVIAMGLLAIVIAGLYAGSRAVTRMRLYNMITSEARALGIQKMEEVTAIGFDNIVMSVPFVVQTNYIGNTYPVERYVQVIGHTTNLTVETNLANSAYLEIHVEVSCFSAFSGRQVTNVYSSIVR